jgi:hypothetical protein
MLLYVKAIAMLSPCHPFTVMIDDTTSDTTQGATRSNDTQPSANDSA